VDRADWTAEQIRIVLRAAECWHAPAPVGFTVDSIEACYLVSICGDADDRSRPPQMLARVAAVLAGAG
jgi:hypothetical protein